MPAKIEDKTTKPAAIEEPEDFSTKEVVTIKKKKVGKKRRDGAPAESETPQVIIKNFIRQKIMLDILDAKGISQHVEIPAKGHVYWPKLDDYGPDIAIKRRGKLIILHEV